MDEVFAGLGWMHDLDDWLEKHDVVGVALGEVVLVGTPQDVDELRKKIHTEKVT